MSDRGAVWECKRPWCIVQKRNVAMTMPRKARISARTTPEVLTIVKHSAEIVGRSLTDFVVAAASATARVTIEQTETIRLSGEDARLFAQLLLDPPPVAPAMQRAFEHHRRMVGDA